MNNRHTREKARFRELFSAMYQAALDEMPKKKRRMPHHRERAHKQSFRNAYAISNRQQRRALGHRNPDVKGKMATSLKTKTK